MKILSQLDNHVIVSYTKEEFELLSKHTLKPSVGFRPSIGSKSSTDSVRTPSKSSQKEPELYFGPTMTFRYGDQVIRKTQEELAFEDYRGPFIPD